MSRYMGGGWIKHVKDDGGRSGAGYKGRAGDCVARALSIATGLPYREVYARLAAETGAQRATKRAPKRPASANRGISVRRRWFKATWRSWVSSGYRR